MQYLPPLVTYHCAHPSELAVVIVHEESKRNTLRLTGIICRSLFVAFLFDHGRTWSFNMPDIELWTCIYTYIYSYIHAYIHTHTHTHIQTHTCACIYICVDSVNIAVTAIAANDYMCGKLTWVCSPYGRSWLLQRTVHCSTLWVLSTRSPTSLVWPIDFLVKHPKYNISVENIRLNC